MSKTSCWMLIVSLALTVSLPGTAHGGQTTPTRGSNDFDKFASQLLEKFDETDRKSIAVVDLQPVFGKPGSFGPWLADQLSSAIARHDQKVGVIDRPQVRRTIGALPLSPDDESEAKNAVVLGKALNANTVVVGSYEAAQNGIGITLVAFRTGDRDKRPLAGFVASMVFQKLRLAPDVHLDMPLDSMLPTDGVYKSGHGGVSIPTCLKCPGPNMKVPDVDIQGLIRAHPHGAAVRLLFIVDQDGHTKNIGFRDPVGFGVDEQFATAAKDWEFKPAVDVDGRSVSVAYTFQYSFNFK